jgi:hypothetical protein
MTVVALAAALAAWPGTAFADWSGPRTVGGLGEPDAVAVDAAGDAAIVATSAVDHPVVVYQRRGSAGRWTRSPALGSGGGDADVALNRRGDALVVWRQDAQVLAATRIGGG